MDSDWEDSYWGMDSLYGYGNKMNEIERLKEYRAKMRGKGRISRSVVSPRVTTNTTRMATEKIEEAPTMMCRGRGRGRGRFRGTTRCSDVSIGNSLAPASNKTTQPGLDTNWSYIGVGRGKRCIKPNPVSESARSAEMAWSNPIRKTNYKFGQWEDDDFSSLQPQTDQSIWKPGPEFLPEKNGPGNNATKEKLVSGASPNISKTLISSSIDGRVMQMVSDDWDTDENEKDVQERLKSYKVTHQAPRYLSAWLQYDSFNQL